MFLLRPFQSHVLAIKGEAARLGDVGGCHRDNDTVRRARDCAGAGISEAVFKLELKRVAGNFCRPLAFGRGAMAVVMGRVEGDLHSAAGLFDAQLKNGAAVEEFLVGIFANPTGRLSSKGSRQPEKEN